MPYGNYPRTPRNTGRALARIRSHNNRIGGNFFGRNLLRAAARTAGNAISNKLKSMDAKRNFRKKRQTKPKVARDVTITSDHTGLAVKKLGTVKMYKKKARHGKTVGKFLFQNSNQWVINGTQGFQVVDYVENCFTRNQITGDILSNVRSDRNALPINLFQLNPYATRDNQALYPGPHPETSRSDVLYIKSAHCDMHLLSMTNVPQEVLVYWMTPKYDTGLTPITSWANILSARNAGQVASSFAVSTVDTTAGVGSTTINDYGNNPFVLPEFRNCWRAVSSSRVILQAGEQVNLALNFDFEKIIARATLESRVDDYLAGITIFPMIIVRGGLAGIHAPAEVISEVATEVSYAPTKVGIVTDWKMTFGALGASRLSTANVYKGEIGASLANITTIDDQDQEVLVFQQ